MKQLKMKLLVTSVAAVLGGLGAVTASADQGTGAGGAGGLGGNASAQVRVSVVIPAFVRLTVGTATAGTIDTVSMSPTTADVGTANVINGNASVAVSVLANNAAAGVRLSYAVDTTGVGAAGAPAWGAITMTGTGTWISNGGQALNAAGGNALSVNNASGIVNASDTISFSYSSSTVYRAGTYTGTITYTATEI